MPGTPKIIRHKNRVMPNYMYSDFEDCGFLYSKTKRVRHVYQYLYEPDNLLHCVQKSQVRKHRNKAVVKFNENFYDNLDSLYWMLRNEQYVPGRLRERKIYEPKERLLKIPPYYPDRIIDHCVVSVVEPILMQPLIAHSYSCIKGRGIHGCLHDIVAAIQRDPTGTRYALIMDIHKYYDSIEHSLLKRKFRRKIADHQMLRLMDAIVDTVQDDKGLPIGRFTSQLYANYNLADYEHYALEILRVHYLYVYMDNIVILSGSKDFLHEVFSRSALFLATHDHLELNANWQVFPIASRDLDHVGFRISPKDVRLRRGILYRFYDKLRRTQAQYDLRCEVDIKHAYPSEYGWLTHVSPHHKDCIINKILKDNEQKLHQPA